MSAEQAAKPPVWFWIIVVVMTLWNAAGVAAFVAQVTMTPEALAQLPAEEQALYTGLPVWALAAFAVAVFGGLLGCLGLILRKRWAVPLFVLSLIGVLVQFGHALLQTSAVEVHGTQAVIGPVVIIVAGIFLIWFSLLASKRQWLT